MAYGSARGFISTPIPYRNPTEPNLTETGPVLTAEQKEELIAKLRAFRQLESDATLHGNRTEISLGWRDLDEIISALADNRTTQGRD